MSLASTSTSDLAEEERRARKLEAAKKKLKSFRATRTSGPSSAGPSHTQTASGSSTKSSLASRSPRLPSTVLPLSTENGGNISTHVRVNSKGKGKMLDGGLAEPLGRVGLVVGHERVRSGAKASGRHRRQMSSISALPHSLSLQRPPEAMEEEEPVSRRAGMRMAEFKLNLPVPREINLTPATPLLETSELDDPFGGPLLASAPEEAENVHAVKQRLSAFSFGAKPGALPPSPSRSPTGSPNRRTRINPSLLPSLSLRSQELNLPPSPSRPSDTFASTSAPAGLDKLAHGTPARPPSLLFTGATPLMPSPSAPHRLSLSGFNGESPVPSTPPTPARKRHSHTRSNSISLPALKIGAVRPISLGIPSSPSFPSTPGSPVSPDESKLGPRSALSGTRLKFEPSEAEMAKEESRRKALEKLTGNSPLSSPIIEERPAEISLPDLEDDTSSTTSSSRPLSSAWGSGTFSFGRPNSLGLPSASSHIATPIPEPSLFPAWPADDASPMSFDKWSSGFKEESLGFGLESMPKRGSFQGNLAVLPEVEEIEEEEDEEHVEHEGDTSLDLLPTTTHEVQSTPIVQPTPSRLRELHLLSSGPVGTPGSIESIGSFSRGINRPAPTSPTKGYGMIGRGRPRPLSGISAKASISTTTSGSTTSPLTATVVTPKTARMAGPRRRLSGSGRRSSISYKKDRDPAVLESMSAGSSVSSRWSINDRSVVSPPPPNDISSPPLTSPPGSSWAHVPRSSNRPCPRPKSLVGLGIHPNAGSGRILSEVLEKDEGDEREPLGLGLGMGTAMGDGWHSAPPVSDRPFTFRSFGSLEEMEIQPARRSLDSEGTTGRWRDDMLELEMERDALREDVDGWRERCRSLEERLEDEKRESGILRDRVRKLGDRLLTLSTNPPESPARSTPSSGVQESRVLSEMRAQLFNLTSAVERERRDKEAAEQRIAALEAQLKPVRYAEPAQPEWSFKPYQSPPSTFEYHQQQPYASALAPSQSPSTYGTGGSYNSPWPSSPIITPATPAKGTPSHPFTSTPCDTDLGPHSSDGEAEPEPDLNSFRMRAWGFPSVPSPGIPSAKQSKRESFFGLSQIPLGTGGSVAEMETGTELYDGVDLPPFVLPHFSLAATGTSPLQASMPIPINRAVSDPVLSPARTLLALADETAGSVQMTKSASAGSFGSSALSLLSGYLPTRSPTKAAVTIVPEQQVPTTQAALQAGVERTGGKVDMRMSCRCCVGDVIEL